MEKEETEKTNKETEYLEQMQRLQAEFENFRKRTEREKQENLKNANEELITKLLEVLDSFELALKHTDNKGIKMIYSELYTILQKEGLEPIKTEGKFDPRIHEALIQEEGEEDGKITEELQKGYKLNDKLIRASKVKITKTMENKNE
ncbi:nucleotide exchange factor GrpE [Candidatus Pacearchaeota archaeon]|nr:nucleotide exchange factor GrpE [Candidatus Pacearchaeota archaeon]